MKLKFIKLTLLLFIPLFLFVSCQNRSNQNSLDQNQQSSKLKVLCTTGMVADLVTQIGGDRTEVTVLIKEELDPHTYELVKGDDEKLTSSDLVFYNGLGLEHSPNIFRHLKEHPQSLALGDQIKKQSPDRIIYVDGEQDPHIWMDVSLWELGVDPITKALQDFDPGFSDYYSENAKILHEKMQLTHHKIAEMLQEIPESQRYLVTCHDAFNYFTRTYLATDAEKTTEAWKVRCKAPEGLAPDSQLSVADIQAVLTHLKEHQIEVIFPESNVNLDSIKKIKEASKKMGLTLFISPYALYGDSMGKKGEGQDTYLAMLYYNAEVIAKCLKSKEAYAKR